MGKLTAQKLTAEETEALVQAKLQWLLGLSQPLAIWLIGSAARGEMTDASDIDLVLLFENESIKKTSMAAVYKTPCTVEWPTDLLPYSQEEFTKSANSGGGVCWLALREGRLLYGKVPSQ